MKRLIVGILIGAMLTGATSALASAHRSDTYHGAKYALQEDLWGFMYTLRLRHCSNPAPRTLTLVEARLADSVVIYRCGA